MSTTARRSYAYRNELQTCRVHQLQSENSLQRKSCRKSQTKVFLFAEISCWMFHFLFNTTYKPTPQTTFLQLLRDPSKFSQELPTISAPSRAILIHSRSRNGIFYIIKPFFVRLPGKHPRNYHKFSISLSF